MPAFGKFIVAIGILLILTGLAVVFINKVFPLGQLPGDITIEQGNFKFYLPFATGFVLSGIVSGVALLITLLF